VSAGLERRHPLASDLELVDAAATDGLAQKVVAPERTAAPLSALMLLPDSAALDEVDAAAFLGISRQALARLRRQGSGPHYVRMSARAVIYFKRDLAAWREAASGGSSIGRTAN